MDDEAFKRRRVDRKTPELAQLAPGSAGGRLRRRGGIEGEASGESMFTSPWRKPAEQLSVHGQLVGFVRHTHLTAQPRQA